MIKWSDAQLRAIKANEGNYLVSASAGSGKTAVLVERVYRLIKEGTELDQFLILTFTNYAASNMREKIRAKLMKDGLVEEASLLDAVSIQTFDAYALDLVKKYYYKLGLRDDIHLVDASILELEQKKILNDIFDEHYEKTDQSFLTMIGAFSYKDDNNIYNFILDLSKKADLSYDKKEALKEYLNKCEDEFVNKVIDGLLNKTKDTIGRNYSLSKSISYEPTSSKLIEFYEPLLNLSTYEDFYNYFHIDDIKYVSKNTKNMTEEEIILFDKIKADYMALKDYFIIPSMDEIYVREKYQKMQLELMIPLIEEMDRRLNDFKRRYNSYDFKDIFKFALDLVHLSDVKEELKNKYRFIMIDEYQDTSDLQELFISQIANNNVFMVGDIKQSIYRFRNANPNIFLAKFNEYGKGINGERIDFIENHRSSEEVISLVNEIFKVNLNKEDTGLDYENEHMMIAGHGDINKGKSNLSHLNNEEIMFMVDENEQSEVKEAKVVASDILRRIKIGEEVFDKEKGKYRPISFSDFAILSYSTTHFLAYQKVFEEFSIPLFANYRKKMHESDITLILENVIKCIDILNRDEDMDEFVHPYMSILRSVFVSADDDYIDDILSRNAYQNDETYLKLLKISKNIDEKLLTNILEEIIKEFDVYEKLIILGDVSLNLELITHYYEITKNMDNMEYDLSDLATYFDELKEYEIEPEYDASKSIDDAVKLMTIHASKGLEFKYVYIIQTYRKFNFMDSTGKYLISDKYGVHLPDFSYPNIDNYNINLIKKEDKKEALLEQIRVFYVALTRAEEKLILLKKVSEKESSKAITSPLEAGGYHSFLSIADYIVDEIDYSLNISLPPKEDKKDIRAINISDKVTLNNEVVKKARASKESLEKVDTLLLDLGNKYHYYLELTDFKSKDTSFILNSKDKKIIDKFLSNPIFNKPNLEKVLHEYSFYNEELKMTGVIDLMLIYKDSIDIIDFKLSNIDDINYDRQVKIYKDYIATLTNKPINLYVTGILSNKIREIK